MKSTLFFLGLILLIFSAVSTVRAVDIVSNPETVTVTATVGSTTPPPGGGGGGGDIPSQTSITFSGYAYPGALVIATQVNKLSTQTTANSDGSFFLTLPATASTSSSLILEARDTQGRQSPFLVYTLYVRDAYITQVQNIIFPPTIYTNSFELGIKDTLSIAGFTQPFRIVEGAIRSFAQEKSVQGKADEGGWYTITTAISDLQKGQYTIYTTTKESGRLSRGVPLLIREAFINKSDTTANLIGDCNFDEKVDLVDFSIFAFWYKKPKPPACVDINHDGQVTIIDFSILAYYWTRINTHL